MISNIFVISVVFLLSQVHTIPTVEATPAHGRTSEDLETIKIAMDAAWTPEFSFLPKPIDLESIIAALYMYTQNNSSHESKFDSLLHNLRAEAKATGDTSKNEKDAILNTLNAIEKDLKAFEAQMNTKENIERFARKEGYNADARNTMLSGAYVILTTYIAKLKHAQKDISDHVIGNHNLANQHIDRAVQILEVFQRSLETARNFGRLNPTSLSSYEKREKTCEQYFDKFNGVFPELELIKKAIE